MVADRADRRNLIGTVPTRSKLLRDPLVHFLAVGVLLFFVFEWLDVQGEDVIVVDASTLNEFIRSRDPRLDDDAAGKALGTSTEGQRRQLADDYIREEVLFREAVALGLDTTDYAAKRRLVSQIEYLNRGIAYGAIDLTDAELAAYYAENEESYRVPSQRTFTHVFLSAGTQGDEAIGRAMTELEWLNEAALPFHESGTRGERFLFHRNYVDQPRADIAAHFGAAFADELFALAASTHWQGPLVSDHGTHLVLITATQPTTIPPLSSIRRRVADDLAQARVNDALDAFFETAKRRYRIEIRPIEARP